MLFRFVKAAWILSWAVALTLVLFFPILFAALLGKRGDAAFHGTQVYAWVILKVCGIRLRVSGLEHIRKGQKYVILSNHASYLDPPALVLSLGLQYRWVIKKELRKVPLFGLALEASVTCSSTVPGAATHWRASGGAWRSCPRGPESCCFPRAPAPAMAGCCRSNAAAS